MNTVQLREAKAKLSALVDAAERGEGTIITRYGKPAAKVVPLTAADRSRPVKNSEPNEKKQSFAEWLLSYPGGLELERDQSPPRAVDF
jgi:prevent-host-death family protein